MYGGSPDEVIHVPPGSFGSPAEELKQVPIPPHANPPEVPDNSQTRKGWYHPAEGGIESLSNRAVPVSHEELVESPNASKVRFVER